jgi:hypothetical protein
MRLPSFTALASLESIGNNYISASAQSGGAVRGVITAQSGFCPPGMNPVQCCLENGGRMECQGQPGHVHCVCVR